MITNFSRNTEFYINEHFDSVKSESDGDKAVFYLVNSIFIYEFIYLLICLFYYFILFSNYYFVFMCRLFRDCTVLEARAATDTPSVTLVSVLPLQPPLSIPHPTAALTSIHASLPHFLPSPALASPVGSSSSQPGVGVNNAPCSTLFVANLGQFVSEHELKEIFSRCA
jgi:hypothetical protein